MSKRYGRNQKRAHRNRIAELEKALKASNVHATQLRANLRAADEEIETAKGILGPYCVSFNAQRHDMQFIGSDHAEIISYEQKFGGGAHAYWDYKNHERVMEMPSPLTRVRLPIMAVLAKQQGDAHKARQLDVYYEGRIYGVAIEPHAFMCAREPILLLRSLAERMAVAMYNELRKGGDGDRIRRTHTRDTPDPMIETPRFR